MDPASSTSAIQQYVEWIRCGDGSWSGDEWHKRSDVIRAYQMLAEESLRNFLPVPNIFSGRGIVTIAGGAKYFTNAWVLTRMLRHLGCQLPIQFWHFPGEVDERMQVILEPWGVECVNVDAVVNESSDNYRPAGHWELKVFSILHSPFSEVLYSDADVIFVRDPSYLFDEPPFRETGVALWPDYTRWPADHAAWEVFQVQYRDEPECQGGTLLYHKEQAWPVLQQTLHYNRHSEFYYRYIYSDKDTYRMACHRLNRPFAMPMRFEHLDGTICHSDFSGRRVTQHRYGHKWRLSHPNRRIDGFWFEDECLGFLEELRELWNGEPFLPHIENPT